ncbi:hypothetical protein NW754_003975 [Fusarium falciforme]|nr:hypothetical protein NW754_003975 [Fusarium falciforme]
MAITNILIYKFKAFPQFYNLLGYSNIARRFITLLLYTQRFAATDPRDKVFALSGLHLAGATLHDDDDWDPKAGYITPWEVLYTNVTLRNLEKGWLNTLPIARKARQPRDWALPLWVPDYRRFNPETQVSMADDLDSVSQGTPVLNRAVQNSGIFRDFRFTVTKHGYFCLVHSITQVKDRVAVLTGSMATIALRPWQANEYVELLGDAYVHGMMVNEAPRIVLELDCKADPTDEQRERILRDSKRNNGEAWRTLGIGDYTPILDTLGKRRINFV